MKSQQKEKSELTTTTSCKDCIFYSNTGNCKAGRLEVLKESIIEENPHKIYGICNLKRLDSWKHSKEENSLDIARKSIMPLFGIVVFDSDDEELEILKTIENIGKITYPENKVKIVISSRKKSKSEKILTAVNKIRKKFKHCVVDFHFMENTKEEEYEAFKKIIKADYFVKLKHDGEIPHDIFLMIDDMLNNRMIKVATFELSKNGSIIMKRLVNSAYPQYRNYEEMEKDLFIQSINKNLYYKII